MDNKQNEAAQKGQGKPARPAPSQNEDTNWEELWLPEEEAVPPEPAWLADLFEQMPLPPEPDDVAELAWTMDTSEEVPTPPELPWYERYWIDDAEEWDDSPGPIHPSGRWEILNIFSWHPEDRKWYAVVRDVKTKKWVWIPDEAILIAWSPDGQEAAVICERRYKPWHTFERYTWPECKQISACPIYMPTGWPIYIAFSPRKDMAVFQWTDQGEAGLEFIILSEDGDYQLRHSVFPQVLDPRWRAFDVVKISGGFPVMYNGFIHPVFSPTGRYIAVGLAGEWYPPYGYISPSIGQASRAGVLYILDWDERTAHQIIVTHEVPSSDDTSSTRDDFLEFHELVFFDEEHVSLKLIDGRVKVYHIYTDSSLVQ